MNDKKPGYFEKDVRRIEGNGDFPCPECGRTISPDDKSGESYIIVKTRTRNEELATVTLVCGGCQSQTKLTGFSAKPLQRFQYCIV